MSGRKNTLPPYQLITDGDMSTASITSVPVNIQYMDNIGIQLTFTGSPTGTFSVQVSADYTQTPYGHNTANAGNWTTLTLSPSPAAAGSGATIFIDLNQLSAPWIRVVYTKTSGTGTLQGYITAKML